MEGISLPHGRLKTLAALMRMERNDNAPCTRTNRKSPKRVRRRAYLLIVCNGSKLAVRLLLLGLISFRMFFNVVCGIRLIRYQQALPTRTPTF